MPAIHWRTPDELSGHRLDKVVGLAGRASDREIPRKLARALIESGAVALDGRTVRSSSHRVRGGEHVTVKLRDDAPAPRARTPLAVLYRDEAVVAVEKPAGLPSEPARDRSRPNALALARAALGLEESAFLGLPHRLDKDTSGVLILTLDRAALATLGKSFEEREGTKLYVARVHGKLADDEGRIESFLAPSGTRDGIEVMASVRSGGKKAITLYRVLERSEDQTLVECTLETGRTHQIRVHLSELGHPIVGDELYGAPRGEHARLDRHLLHARLVELPHPSHPGQILRVESALPEGFHLTRP